MIDCHLEDIVYVLAVIPDVKDLALEPFAMACLTDKLKVGHELHLYCDTASTLAFLTASACGIEREILWGITHLPGKWLLSYELSYSIESFNVGSGIGARRLPYRVLVDKLNMLDRRHITLKSTI